MGVVIANEIFPEAVVSRLRRNPAYIHVILLGLEEVEKAPRFGNLIVIVRDSEVCLAWSSFKLWASSFQLILMAYKSRGG